MSLVSIRGYHVSFPFVPYVCYGLKIVAFILIVILTGFLTDTVGVKPVFCA